MKTKMIADLTKLEPSRNESCVCASGKKFKKCCMNNYACPVQKNAFQIFNEGNYSEALNACRHHLTWYILSHQAHTVPFLESKTKVADQLLSLDIEALADILDLLHNCYYITGKSEDFPSVLTYLGTAVDDSRWQDKLVYFKALWWLTDKRDKNAALNAMAKINITECSDPEILALYLDVSLDILSFAERIRILDLIIAISNKPSYRLQYSVFKGIMHCFIKDIEGGCKIIRIAIDAYVALGKQGRSDYGDFILARSFDVLGKFEDDVSIKRNAYDHYKSVINSAKEKGYSAAYLAEISIYLADYKMSIGEYNDAVSCYRDSLKYEETYLAKVLLARAYVHVGKNETARTLLESAKTAALDDSESFDYAISWAILAVHSLHAEDIEIAKARLKQSKSYWPLFTEYKDSLLIQMLEITPKVSAGKLKKLINFLNRYVSLNPNFFGMGININKIIEDKNHVQQANLVDDNSGHKTINRCKSR